MSYEITCELCKVLSKYDVLSNTFILISDLNFPGINWYGDSLIPSNTLDKIVTDFFISTSLT